MGLRLQCNIWRGARLYRRTQTAHSDVEKITKISRESYYLVRRLPGKDSAMTYATVMVNLEIGCSNTGVMSAAADLAERFGAGVVGIAACHPMPIIYTDGSLLSGQSLNKFNWLSSVASSEL